MTTDLDNSSSLGAATRLTGMGLILDGHHVTTYQGRKLFGSYGQPVSSLSVALGKAFLPLLSSQPPLLPRLMFRNLGRDMIPNGMAENDLGGTGQLVSAEGTVRGNVVHAQPLPRLYSNFCTFV